MYEIFAKLLDERGVTTYKVSKSTGIAGSTFTDWKTGRSTPKQDKLQKIADYFGVSIQYLMTGDKDLKTNEKALTRKDERDIERIIKQTEEQLLSQDGLMFDGYPASPEAIESILLAMQVGMEMAKKKNKEIFTSKKHKKD